MGQEVVSKTQMSLVYFLYWITNNFEWQDDCLHRQGAFINVQPRCSEVQLLPGKNIQYRNNRNFSHSSLWSQFCIPRCWRQHSSVPQTWQGVIQCWEFNAAQCLWCQGWNSNLHWIQRFPWDFGLKKLWKHWYDLFSFSQAICLLSAPQLFPGIAATWWNNPGLEYQRGSCGIHWNARLQKW